MFPVVRPARSFAASAALACLLAAGPAGAIGVGGKPAASGAAAKPAAVPAAAASRAAPTVATRDQLRACMNDEDAMRERQHRLEDAHAEHERAIAGLQAESAKIVEVQGQLDRESQTAVTAFNLLVTQHNVRASEATREAGEMSAQSQAFNVESLALNKRCSALAYRLEDMDAVMKERKAAGK